MCAIIPTVQLDRQAEETLFADVIIGSVEGGSGYWSQVSEYRYHLMSIGPSNEASPLGLSPAGGDNASVTMHYDNPSAQGRLVTRVDLAKIEQAFVLMAKGPVHGLADVTRIRMLAAQIMARAGDRFAAGDLDALDFDAIMQVALFGEVPFG